MFRHGWFHSGDSCAYEDDGQQILVDRYKDIVKSGGENVSSARVEGALHPAPGVARVAVIGIPHERWGELSPPSSWSPTASRPPTTELIAFARERLAGYETPKQIIWADELPETVGGKVLKYKLRERYGSEHELAEVRAPLHPRVRRRRRRSSGRPPRRRAATPGSSMPQQPREVARAAHRRAEQRELAEVERPHVERRLVAAGGAEGHDAAARLERRQRVGQVEPTESTTRSGPGSSCCGQSASVYRTPPVGAELARRASIFSSDDDVTSTRAPAMTASETAIVETPLPAPSTTTVSPARRPPRLNSARYAVTPASGSAAASGQSKPAGSGNEVLLRDRDELGVGARGVSRRGSRSPAPGWRSSSPQRSDGGSRPARRCRAARPRRRRRGSAAAATG